jgi:hypothetical protein
LLGIRLACPERYRLNGSGTPNAEVERYAGEVEGEVE